MIKYETIEQIFDKQFDYETIKIFLESIDLMPIKCLD